MYVRKVQEEMGNLELQFISNIWVGDKYLEFMSEVVQGELCRGRLDNERVNIKYQ